MTLNDSVHRLTRPHLTHARDGSLREMPALLAELRQAITPGRNSSGNGSAEGAPIPIDPTALDLIRTIETEARKDYNEATGTTWRGTLEALLQEYPAATISTEWENYLAGVTLGWVDQITAYLWPTKPRRKLVGTTCPSCGWATYGEERKTCLSVGCWDEDGNINKPAEWDVECAACEASWSGKQIDWLLKALNTTEDAA